MQRLTGEMLQHDAPADLALLERLVRRGDAVSVHQGRLVIEPGSGAPVCPTWYEQHSVALVRACCLVAGVDAFFFQSFTRGIYGEGRNAAVCLQFNGPQGQSAYALFNAKIKYQRGPKRGHELPGKHFHVARGSALVRFWNRCGLPLPQRLGKFGDHLGNLRGIAVTGPRNGERFQASKIEPATIGADALRALFCPNIIRTSPEHHPNNSRTTFPNKETPETRATAGFEPDSNYRGNLVQLKETPLNRDTGEQVIHSRESTGEEEKTRELSENETAADGYCTKPPAEQTVEGWLADYDRRDRELWRRGLTPAQQAKP